MMKAILVLADGIIVEGWGFGACKEVVGEVVFNTGMTGYTEALTDPSYKGQILLLTFPSIGNYAIPPHFESNGIKAEGLIVRDACKELHHWQSDKTIMKWLEENDIPGIEGVDTRALTRKIRAYGVIPGALATYKEKRRKADTKKLLENARQFDIGKIDLVAQVAARKTELFDVSGKHTVVLIDCGAKANIIRELNLRKINVVVVPPSSKPKEVLQYQPDGLVISNGPGDPAVVTYVHKTVRELLSKFPILGICLGHQIIALAAGARTYKLKFGHRGANQPVKDIETGLVHITSQNHGYAVDASSLEGTGFEVTKINVNDGTVEGISHRELPIISIQYHPEASPGPLDNKYLFDEFVKLMKNSRNERILSQRVSILEVKGKNV